MREKRNRSNMVSNSHLTHALHTIFVSSSSIIVQQNETEPGEPSSFQLTSEDSKHDTILMLI